MKPNTSGWQEMRVGIERNGDKGDGDAGSGRDRRNVRGRRVLYTRLSVVVVLTLQFALIVFLRRQYLQRQYFQGYSVRKDSSPITLLVKEGEETALAEDALHEGEGEAAEGTFAAMAVQAVTPPNKTGNSVVVTTQSLPPTPAPTTTKQQTTTTPMIVQPTINTTKEQTNKQTLIFCLANYKYREAAEHWYHRLNDLGYKDHYVLAYEDRTATYFSKKGIRTENLHEYTRQHLPHCPGSLKDYDKIMHMFAVRWLYVLLKLKAGYNLLMSDADSVWSRYVDVKELDMKGFDMYHTYANRMPQKIFDKTSFVICGCLNFVKSSPAAIKFVEQLLNVCNCLPPILSNETSSSSCNCRCDDQITMNTLLFNNTKSEIQWLEPPDQTRQEKGQFLAKGRSGMYLPTGHTFQIFDRNYVHRGIHNLTCPQGNWVTFPKTTNESMSKLEQMHVLDDNCPIINQQQTAELQQQQQHQQTKQVTQLELNITQLQPGIAKLPPPSKEELSKLYQEDKRMQISRRHQIFFVHIPKTGGTSIENSALFADKLPTKAKGHRFVSEYLERPYTFDFKSFAMVRHPCERFISAFKFLKSGGTWEGDAKWARDNIGNMTLDEWVERGILDSWFHMGPMWPYTFLQEGNQTVMGVDQIFCQEQFPQATDWVNAQVPGGIFESVPHENKGKNHGGCSDLPDKTRQVIERFYALDYCIFGYEMGRDALKPTVCQAQTMSKQEFTDRYTQCSQPKQ